MAHRLAIAIAAAAILGCGSTPGSTGSGGSGGIAGSAGSGGEGGMAGTGGEGGTGGEAGSGGSGGSGGAPTCDDLLASFDPCGGDVTGTWTADQFCVPSATGLPGLLAQTPDCKTATFDVKPSLAGTWTFAADGSYTSTLVSTIEADLGLPDACLSALAGGLPASSFTCSLVPAVLKNAVSGATASCGYASAVCSCTLQLKKEAPASGHYTASGGMLTDTDHAANQPLPYCISGDQLELQSSATLAGNTAATVLILHR